MALQQTILLDNGLTATDAYWRIERFQGDRNRLRITVEAYFDAASAEVDPESRATAKPPLASKTYDLPTPNTASNMFEAAYGYLKTQDFFVTCTDV
jgi:hypothetical protein